MTGWSQGSASEQIARALEAIEQVEPQLNAYVEIASDQAKQAAHDLDAHEALDELPLFGMPVAVKDNIAAEGQGYSAGTRLWLDRKAEFDSPVVARLKSAGAIVAGKTTMPEFGHSATGVSHIWGPTRNPWNLDLSTGGSSSGSAASVAAGCVPGALGTDGGGSVRIPASFSGIYALKPSLGRVPYSPASPTLVLAHIGPMTRTVRDAALIMDAIKGPHPGEAASLPPDTKTYADNLEQDGQGLRIAYSPSLFGAPVDAKVAASFSATIAALSGRSDVSLSEVSLDHWEDPLDPFIVLWISAQGVNVYDLYEGDLSRLDPGLEEIVIRARETVMPDHVPRAYWARARFIECVERFFDEYDILLTPTCACLPFGATEDSANLGNGDSMSWAEMVRFTYPFNFSGHPAASVPGIPTQEGTPVGLQVIGPRFRDDLVLAASALIENTVPWADRQPGVWAGP